MNKLTKAFLPVTTFAKIDIKRLFRDKVAIFFVFIFPLIFLVLFGSIFSSDNKMTFRVGLLNQSSSQFSADFARQIQQNQIFKVDQNITDLAKAKEKMNRGQLEATIILPADFGAPAQGKTYPSGQAVVLYSQSNESAGQTLGSVMDGIFKQINQKLAPAEQPFSVKTQSTATKGLTRFDYTFAGMMGFTLLSLGIFGPTTVFPRLKQKGVLKRYHTTTLKVWQYFVANVMSNAGVGLLSLVFMFVSAVLIFDLNMRGSYINLAVIVVMGVTMLFGIGLALGGWAKNENQAAPLAQLDTIPMMFLSGVFFPTYLMPEFLQSITKFIPLTPVIDSIRLVITENASLASLGPQLAIISAWTVAIYFVAFRVFRWE